MQTQEVEKNEAIEVLPAEILQLTSTAPEKKKDEIILTLNQIFAGTDEWEKQIDAIVVKDINDAMSIGMAEVARKNAKTAKINADRIIKAKREEVKSQMAEFTLEDSLWLKAGQIAKLKLENIEKKAEAKADFVKIYNAQQKEIETQKRINIIAEYGTFNRIEFENLSAVAFEAFVSGLKAKKEAEAEQLKKQQEIELAKQEAQKLHNQRKEQLIPYWIMLTDVQRNADLSKVTEARFLEVLSDVKNKKKTEEDEAKKLKEENERLAAQLKEASEERKVRQTMDAAISENTALPILQTDPKTRFVQSFKRNLRDGDAGFVDPQKMQVAKEGLSKKTIICNWIDSFELPEISLTDDPEVELIKSKFKAYKEWAHKQIQSIKQ